MATLSSTYDVYVDALQSLAALFEVRGYPTGLVRKWLSDNMSERWKKRLDTSNQSKDDTEGVFILKTTYNTAWNYFSAKQLGDSVIGTWKREVFLSTLDPNLNSLDNKERIAYLHPSASWAGLSSVSPDFLTDFWTADGPRPMPDISKLGFLNNRFIVSRKRTKNLFDLTSLWKKTVLQKMEEDISESPGDDLEVDVDEVDMDISDDDDDSDDHQVNRCWSPT